MFVPHLPGEAGSVVYRREEGAAGGGGVEGLYLYYRGGRWWVGESPGTACGTCTPTEAWRSQAGASPARPPGTGWEWRGGGSWCSESVTVEYGVRTACGHSH